MAYKFIDSSFVRHFNRIQAVADKFEADLIGSGRYIYLKTEDNKKIYVEKTTGREVPVLMPSFHKKPAIDL